MWADSFSGSAEEAAGLECPTFENRAGVLTFVAHNSKSGFPGPREAFRLRQGLAPLPRGDSGSFWAPKLTHKVPKYFFLSMLECEIEPQSGKTGSQTRIAGIKRQPTGFQTSGDSCTKLLAL